jgi:hypothetical protein
MKCAFADIRNHYTELMAARAHGLIQTQKKTTEFGANAKHSKNPKLPTVSHEEQRLTPHDSGYESQNVFRCGLAIDWPCMGILVTQ